MQNTQLCERRSDLASTIVADLRSALDPTVDQMPLLQKLGGALGAASGFLAKACPNEIPAQPVARLQLMESQIEELAMAIDIVRQPLQDFEQSLNDADSESRSPRHRRGCTAAASGRRASFRAAAARRPRSTGRSSRSTSRCSRPTRSATRSTIVKQAFAKAASDLEAHCPTTVPPTALGRLETIEARLDATWRSVLSIQVALANFETKLSDEQKDRFDAMNFAAR